MSIRINTRTYQATGTEGAGDTPSDKIVKYIPSDIVGAWVAMYGIVRAAVGVPTETVLWIAFAFGIVITMLWKLKQTQLWLQAIISTGAFAVWIFALGGPFEYMSWYNHAYGSIALIAYTLITSLINPD